MTSTTAYNSRLKRIVRKLLVAAVWLALWQLVNLAVKQEILLPSPMQTAQKLLELAQTGQFWISAFLSLLRILYGFILGVLFGAILGVVTAKIPLLYDFFSPALSIIKATPVASFIILALVWIKKDNVPVFISFLMVLPIIWANTSEGIHQTDKELLEMAKIFRFSTGKLITKIYIPSVMPYFFASCTTSLGFAWKAGIAAEVLSLPKFSIGSELYLSKLYIETPALFAWTAAVVIMSILLEKLLVIILNKIKK